MAEEPQLMTLQQRIASLNAAHVGRIPGDPPAPRPRPQVPLKRPEIIKHKTINNPPEQLNGSITDIRVGNQPAGKFQQPHVLPPPNTVRDEPKISLGARPPPPPLPKRQPSLPPPLPSRKGSEDDSRRGSEESIIPPVYDSGSDGARLTLTRTKSSDASSRVKAPQWGETELPALPIRGQSPAVRKYSSSRPKYVIRAPSSTAVTPGTTPPEEEMRPGRPSLPPRLPSRKPDFDHLREQDTQTSVQNGFGRDVPPMPSLDALEKIKLSALSFGFREKPESNSITQSDLSNGAHSSSVVSSVPSSSTEKIRASAISLGLGKGQDITPKTSSAALNGDQLPSSTRLLPSAATVDKAKRSALSYGLNKPQEQSAVFEETHQPPPVPLSSRPDLSAIQATKPKTANSHSAYADTRNGASNVCLICRDFSGPDRHATLFPRSQVASLQMLAQQLTSPFPSATDKARAIFTWLHHNISYDVESFFNNNVRGSTPQSTLHSGLAVCEGYAAMFTNLATYAGLESVVISGHGKGFGYSPLAPGSPIPPYNAGHAWNAVMIDNGEWKLIDPCWGAGHVQGKGLPYVPSFNEKMFSMTNEEFGIRHFPGNKNQFFLPGDRRMSWDEYMMIDPARWPSSIEPPTIFTNARTDYGIGDRTVLPRDRKLQPSQGDTVRFQFSLLCPHWTLDRHTKKGLPPVFMIAVHGVDGRNKEHIPLEYVRGQNAGGGGDTWFCDVPSKELGSPGQTVTLFAVTSFSDRKDARGLTVREFREGKGKVSMGFMGVAAWDLV